MGRSSNFDSHISPSAVLAMTPAICSATSLNGDSELRDSQTLQAPNRVHEVEAVREQSPATGKNQKSGALLVCACSECSRALLGVGRVLVALGMVVLAVVLGRKAMRLGGGLVMLCRLGVCLIGHVPTEAAPIVCLEEGVR